MGLQEGPASVVPRESWRDGPSWTLLCLLGGGCFLLIAGIFVESLLGKGDPFKFPKCPVVLSPPSDGEATPGEGGSSSENPILFAVQGQLRENASSTLQQLKDLLTAVDPKEVQQDTELRARLLELVSTGGTSGGTHRANATCTQQPQRLRDRPEIVQAIQAAIELHPNDKEPQWYKNRTFPAEPASSWQQHTMKLHGRYGFIQFSGYRTSAKQFSAPGLAATALNWHRELQGCEWTSSSGEKITGVLTMDSMFIRRDMPYHAAVLLCTLKRSTGTRGGHVEAQVDYERFVMVAEEPSEDGLDPQGPFVHQLACCIKGLWDGLVPRQVWEFLEYHRVVHQVDHFYLYNSGALDLPVQQQLAGHMEKGYVTITDLREALLFSTELWGQLVAHIDCIHRNKYTAKWIFVADVDEYLIVPPPGTLQAVLAKYHDRPWLTHGAFFADVCFCANRTSSTQFLVELMPMIPRIPYCEPIVLPFHETNPYICPGANGHRKYFLNPRKVDVVEFHLIKDIKGQLPGVDLDAKSELRHFHYRGLGSTRKASTFCSQPLKAANRAKVEKNMQVAGLISAVRKCPLGSAKDCFSLARGPRRH